MWDSEIWVMKAVSWGGLGAASGFQRTDPAVTRYFKAAWVASTTNTVLAAARSAANGQNVLAADSVVALVQPAGLACQLLVTSPDDQDSSPADAHVRLNNDGAAYQVAFTIVLQNTSGADLANLTVSAPALLAAGCALPPPFHLPAGAVYSNTVCLDALSCANLPLAVVTTVTADVGGACAFDYFGQPVRVSTSCAGRVDCGGTGGGGGECPKDYSYWRKNLAVWPAPYFSGQTIGSVFIGASGSSANATLLDALKGKAGSGKSKAKDLFKQAVTAMLNASSVSIRYPFTPGEVINSVNAALVNGTAAVLEDLTALLKEANEPDCP